MFQAVRNFLIGAVVVMACYYLLENALQEKGQHDYKKEQQPEFGPSSSDNKNDLYAFVFSDEKSPHELASSYARGLQASAGPPPSAAVSAAYQAYDNNTMFETFTGSAPLATMHP
jgi:hypothetical protein